jgi:diguanylate cyclase (GGDEF)-like protein
MDFQEFVDGFLPMTCVISVEKLPDGKWGEIRLVAGNKAYVDSIEKNPDAPKMLQNKFIPNSLYQEYIPKDTNFEYFCYASAVLKQPQHCYVHPDRYDFWFNLFSLPLDADDGNLCYCTYTQELTHEVETSKMSNISHDTATEVLNTCIKLRGTADFKTTMNEVIKDIRNICDAAYCAILTIDELSNKCGILCEDVSPDFEDFNPDWFTPDFFTIANTWDAIIGGSNCIILKNENDMELIKQKNEVWYDSLIEAHVHSIVLFPLKSGYELLGYIWATNFDTEKTMHIKETLELTTFFLGSEISSYQMFDKFRILSTVDLLTGVLNRNEMNNRVMQLGIDDRPGRKNVGIIFADLNGLKQCNDTGGHEAGDQLLRNAAKLLTKHFGNYEIYRSGGDEFVVIVQECHKEEFEKKIVASRAESGYGSQVCLAIGYGWTTDGKNLRSCMHIADEAMYEDKRNYYKQHPDLAR